MRRTLFAAIAVLALVQPGLAQTAAPGTPQRVRGAIKSLDGNVLLVETDAGDTARITLAPNYTVVAVIPANLSDAKPGTFIGTVAVGPKDRLRAIEVQIFPSTMKGTEGRFDWDMGEDSTMNNGTIEAEVSGSDGRTLTVVSKGEKLTVMVPANAPVISYEASTPAMLTPGTKVFIGATKAADGTLSAARVNAGKDGLTPPM